MMTLERKNIYLLAWVWLFGQVYLAIQSTHLDLAEFGYGAIIYNGTCAIIAALFAAEHWRLSIVFYVYHTSMNVLILLSLF